VTDWTCRVLRRLLFDMVQSLTECPGRRFPLQDAGRSRFCRSVNPRFDPARRATSGRAELTSRAVWQLEWLAMQSATAAPPSALASRVAERARRRADRTSSRTPNHICLLADAIPLPREVSGPPPRSAGRCCFAHLSFPSLAPRHARGLFSCGRLRLLCRVDFGLRFRP